MKKIFLALLFITGLQAQSFLILLDDGVSFLPSDVTGVVAWWDGNVGQATDGGVGWDWTDIIDGKILNAPVADNIPTAGALNGHATLIFDGTNDYMRVANSFNITQPITIYVVVKQITWTNSEFWWDSKTADRMLMGQLGTTPTLKISAGPGFAADNTDLAVNTWGVVRVVYSGASSSIRVDDNAATTGNAGTQNADGFSLGAVYSGGFLSNIEVAEIIIYTGATVASFDTQIMNYLNTKYGL